MIEIRNKQITALINPHGAELTELSKNDGVNVLWEKDDVHWNRVAPNLFPIVGRLLEDKYEYQGETYSLSQHGFIRNRVFERIEKSDSSVLFRFESDELSKTAYPFDFIFEVEYVLNKSILSINYRVTNRGEEALPYSVGGHPGFAIHGSINDYYLDFEQVIETERWLLEGPYYSEKTESIILNECFKLDYKLFENDAIVIRKPNFKKVFLAHKEYGKFLGVYSDSWDAVGFWTKENAPFFCIEPWWGWADSKFSSGKLIEKQGVHFLNTNESKSHSFQIDLL